MEYLDLGPFSHASGTIRLPGSKSISNRVLLLAALAEGETTIVNLLDADDTRVMRAALSTLGVTLREKDGDWVVQGARGAFPVKEADLFLGNAGTAVRPLSAALAVNGGNYRIHGVPRMHERPIGDLVDGLRQIGARIDYEGTDGYPPLRIGAAGAMAGMATGATAGTAARTRASEAAGTAPGTMMDATPGTTADVMAGTALDTTPRTARIDARVPVRVRGDVSSQFLSALLMALPLVRVAPGASGNAVIEVEGELISKPYIDLTIRLMARFGVQVARDGWRRFTVPSGARYQSPGRIVVEGDASSASYFLAAGALGGGPVRVAGVGRASIQGDVAFADALARMGARVTLADDWIEVRGADRGDDDDSGHATHITLPRLAPLDMDCNLIPDAAMTLAVAALFASGPSTLRNIASWRVKETDRLAAMASELRKLGARVTEGDDFLAIAPPERLTPHARIDTYDDHRMAMCFSLVSLAGVPVRINDPACVGKTFPDYFQRFLSLAKT